MNVTRVGVRGGRRMYVTMAKRRRESGEHKVLAKRASGFPRLSPKEARHPHADFRGLKAESVRRSVGRSALEAAAQSLFGDSKN